MRDLLRPTPRHATGEIAGFNAIPSPDEAASDPGLTPDTDTRNIEDRVTEILRDLGRRDMLTPVHLDKVLWGSVAHAGIEHCDHHA